MNKNESNNNASGIDFTGLLQILFIALKLTGCITWGWFYVLLPITIHITLLIIILLIYAILEVWS